MEIDRLSKLYQKHYYKKRQLKTKLKETIEDSTREKNLMKKEVDNLRERFNLDLTEKSTQTDVDRSLFDRILRNHEIIVYQKRLNKNKLAHFIEKIRNNKTKYTALSKKSLLNLIPEIYNEKSEIDIKSDMEGTRKLLMDEFIYKFMCDKFKMNKIIKRNCEQTIMAIIKYSIEDSRVDLIRKFMGVGDDKIRREVLDVYLNILKNLPISFFKLFDEDNKAYLMNTDLCFELFHSKYPQFDLVYHTQDQIVYASTINDNDKQLKIPKDRKYDYYLLTKMYNNSSNFINDLIQMVKSKDKSELRLDKFIVNFQISNREFDFLKLDYIKDIFKRNFIVNSQTINDSTVNFINIDSFLSFFIKKYYFKINVQEFLDISLFSLLEIFQNVEKMITKFFDSADILKEGVIYKKEFLEIINKILVNSDNKWKIGDYYKLACGSDDKDYITKDEFIVFCINTNDIFNLILLALKKGRW
jgi:hypothetical protein